MGGHKIRNVSEGGKEVIAGHGMGFRCYSSVIEGSFKALLNKQA